MLPWCFPAGEMLRVGATRTPIVPCHLNRPIGGCGIDSAINKRAGNLVGSEHRKCYKNFSTSKAIYLVPSAEHYGLSREKRRPSSSHFNVCARRLTGYFTQTTLSWRATDDSACMMHGTPEAITDRPHTTGRSKSGNSDRLWGALMRFFGYAFPVTVLGRMPFAVSRFRSVLKI
jgi:hypothetical protein